MILKVKVKPGSKKEEIVEFGERQYLVYLKERAEDGKANLQILRILSKRLGVPSTMMKIVVGVGARNKIIEVDDKWIK